MVEAAFIRVRIQETPLLHRPAFAEIATAAHSGRENAQVHPD